MWLRAGRTYDLVTLFGSPVIRFLTAHIYAAGTWTAIPGYYNVMNSWQSFEKRLYENGTEYVAWSSATMIGTASAANLNGRLRLLSTAHATGGSAASIATNDSIDLTHADFLCASFEYAFGYTARMGVHTTRTILSAPHTIANAVAYMDIPTGSSNIIKLPVTSIKTSYYVAFMGSSGGAGSLPDIRVLKVWLE